jgi:hypothetical protein
MQYIHVCKTLMLTHMITLDMISPLYILDISLFVDSLFKSLVHFPLNLCHEDISPLFLALMVWGL